MKIFQGTIITCDKNDTVVEYLVEDNGKIVFSGDVLPDRFKGEKIILLGKKALIPSFGDTHNHFTSYSLFASTLDIRDAQNFTEMGEMINDYALQKKDKVILGFGLSAHCIEEKRMITRKELDNLFSERPLMIVKYDGHASVVNTRMLELLPKKIQSLRGFNGETGQLFQEAFYASTDFVTGKISLPFLMRSMQKGVDLMAEKGISIIHTAEGVGFPLDLDVDLVRFMAKGQQLPFQFRILFQTMDVSKVKKRKLPRIGGCFATALDGCFGSEDAALLRPYSNAIHNKGVLFYRDQQVIHFVKKANRQQLQVQLHAIGDAAFDQAVLAFDQALKDFPRKDHRHTIIHACLPTQRGLEKCADLGIFIAAQPVFLHWRQEPLEYMKTIIGKRTNKISPLRKMLDSGISVSGGSDAPCSHPDPVYGIHCACNHYLHEQSVSIQEALKMFTFEAARAGFDEDERGSLEPGKIADMVILDRNPLSLATTELRQMKVETLFLAGKPYQKGQGFLKLLQNNLFNKNVKR